MGRGEPAFGRAAPALFTNYTDQRKLWISGLNRVSLSVADFTFCPELFCNAQVAV